MTLTHRGFSLIETLVAIGIFLAILTAIVSSVHFFYRSNTQALEQAYAINSARKGIEFMVRDIREAAFSDEGSYPVIAITEDEFEFYSDIDGDIFIEKVRYFLDGTRLNKGVTNSAGDPPVYNEEDEEISVVSDNVRNSEESVAVFSYFNASGTPITGTASTTDVAFVTAEVIVDVNVDNEPNPFTLRSSATLRNVRVNQ